MIDVSNKIENNLESEKLNNLEKTLDTIDNVNLEENSVDNVSNSINFGEELENINNPENENSEVVNCLALTVKKDYSLSIVKNVVIRTFKKIWKVAVSIFTLNLFRFFM
ncbi:MAG: hypothetical protein ACI4VQ_04505 [Clostridia bacterium]